MTKATRLIRTKGLTRSTRETVLKEASLVAPAQPARNPVQTYWVRLFGLMRQRMTKRIRKLPRAVWRRR